MLLADPEDEIFQSIDVFLNKQGLNLVDLTVKKMKGAINVQVVVLCKSGLSVAQCSQVHRLLVPRLEQLLESPNLYVELSSPGLERTIKYQREFEFYHDRKIKILLEGANEWQIGYLRNVSSQSVVLETIQGCLTIDRIGILKAKLSDIKEKTK